MSDDLVERVGRELARTGYAFAGIDLTDPYTADADYWNSQARAAIAIVLEEAARCVRRMPSPSSEWMADELLRALGLANKIPAAIRALATK